MLYLNGKRHELRGEPCFATVSDFLRYEKNLRGTKVVCAEGDCGACTVLVARLTGDSLGPYEPINSCISFVYLADRSHLITVEGLRGSSEALHPAQKAMIECNGAQCGYCTPGFVCSLAGLTDSTKSENKGLSEKRVKNALTGNLCRCTGYEAIIKAGCSIPLDAAPKLSSLYDDSLIARDLRQLSGSVEILSNEQSVFLPETADQAVQYINRYPDTRVISGSTDLGVLSNKGKLKLKRLMNLNALRESYEIKEEPDYWNVGAKASLTRIEKALEKDFSEFSKYLNVFASPQIKNAASLAGNIINASPIADSIPFLRVAESELVLKSIQGERMVNINSFIQGGYKKLDLRPGELLIRIRIPKTSARFKLFKVSIRKDLDISTVTFAARYSISKGVIQTFSLAFGGVGPSVLRMSKLEQMAVGQKLEANLFKAMAKMLKQEITPLSDVRGSADYRHQLCHNLLLKFYDEVARQFEPDAELSI